MAHQQEREAVKAAFRSPKWARRVNAMADDQLIAVYLRLKAQNKL